MTEKLRPVVPLAVLLVFGMLWLSWCHDPAVRSTQRLRDSTTVVDAHRQITDRRVAMLAAESLELGGKLRRYARNDSVARGEIARLKARTYVRSDITDSTSRDTLVAIIHAHEADALRRDTLEAAQDSVIASQDSALTLWRALAVERGELLQRTIQERDAYRGINQALGRAANKPSYAVTDIAGGAAIGYGLADKNEAFVIGGAAAIVAPRVIHVLGKLVSHL